jgi:arylsulfatase A-like enzyme
MSRPKNVLWIMCDQLRYDYLGCTGHPILKTPNIDAMAKRGVRFANTYVQSPIRPSGGCCNLGNMFTLADALRRARFKRSNHRRTISADFNVATIPKTPASESAAIRASS